MLDADSRAKKDEPVLRALLSAGALLAVLLLAAGLFQRARSTQADIIPGEYSMEVEVAPSQVALGDQFVARVGVFHDIDELYATPQWKVFYDPAIVEVDAINKAPAAPPECTGESDNGTRVLVSCFSYFAGGSNYSGWAFEIVFRCVANGVATLNLSTDSQTNVFDFDSTPLPLHRHGDSVECSDAVPTGTPLPVTPTATPVTGPRGGVWDLRVSTVAQAVVGQPFVVEAQVFPPDLLGYHQVQWAIDFSPSQIQGVDVDPAANAPAQCANSNIAVETVLLACAHLATNGLAHVGTAWDVTMVCTTPGPAELALHPDQAPGLVSFVETGGPGNNFREEITVNSVTVNCVEPLLYNGLVKSVDGETPAEGEDTILRNLWICTDQAIDGIDNDGNSTVDDEAPSCLNNGEGELIIDELVYAEEDCDTRNDDDDGDGKPVSNDPNSPGYRPECPTPTLEDYILDWVDKDGGELPEGLGAVEFRLSFDHKIFDIAIYESDANEDGVDNDGDTLVDEADEDWANGRFPNCGMAIVTENFIMYGCVSTGTTPGHARPNGIPVARIEVVPEADLGFRIRPGKDNGVVRKLLDQNCQVADIYGDIFPVTNAGLTRDCTDVDVTVRRLEGDLDGDCEVTVVDAQKAAFRYGAFFGQLLYDTFYDLEPFVTPDFDLDIKDMQFVFGRIGSTCAAPVPNNQHPVPAMGVGQP